MEKCVENWRCHCVQRQGSFPPKTAALFASLCSLGSESKLIGDGKNWIYRVFFPKYSIFVVFHTEAVQSFVINSLNLTCRLRAMEEGRSGNKKGKKTSISLISAFHFTIAKTTRETVWIRMFQWYHILVWALKGTKILWDVQHWDLQAATVWAGSSAQGSAMSITPEEGVWNLRKLYWVSNSFSH